MNGDDVRDWETTGCRPWEDCRAQRSFCTWSWQYPARRLDPAGQIGDRYMIELDEDDALSTTGWHAPLHVESVQKA